MNVSKLRRLATWLIDLVVIALLFGGLVRLLPTRLLPPEQMRWWLLGVAFGYYVLTETIFQRTVGKVLTRTAVVTANDEPPAPGQIVLRSLCRFLPLEPLSIFFSTQGRVWHDTFSGTKVVSFGY